MSPFNTSDNYSRWIASSRPRLWPSSNPAPPYLSDDSALPPLQPPTLNDSNNPQAPADSREAVSGSVYPPQYPSNQLLQDQISHLLNVGSPAAFMTLYQYGILTVAPIDGFHAFRCPHCFVFIKSSISVSLALCISGHFTVLSNHYRCKSCTAQHARNEGSAAQVLLEQQRLESTPDSPASSSHDSPSLSEPSLALTPIASGSTISNSDSHPNSLTVYTPPPHPPCYGLPFLWDLPAGTNVQVSLPWLRTLRGKPDELPYVFNIIDGPGVRPNDYLLVEGKFIHKASFCRIFFNSSFTAKSLDRLRRVRGFTSVNKSGAIEDTDHSKSIFVSGSPFLTLVRLNDQTSALALLRSTSIFENGASRTGININTLHSPAAKVKINGDILLLHNTRDSENTWVWTGGCLKSPSPVPNANVSTRKVVELSVHGSLIEPVNPSVITASKYLPAELCREISSRDITWALKEDILEAASTTIWKRLGDLKVPITNITLLSGRHEGFPYSKDNGTPALLCTDATQALCEANVSSTEVVCPLCRKLTSDLRSHMGGHILRSNRGVPEELAIPVGQVLPCGFCGSSGNPDCAIKLKKTKRATEVTTNCPHKVSFKYGFAEKGSQSRPCRNVPIVCLLCHHPEKDTNARTAVWRYNMEQHLDLKHPEYAHPGKSLGLPLSSSMFNIVMITRLEEEKFGVPARSRAPSLISNENIPPAASTSSGQKRQADAGQFRIIIASSHGTKRARIA